jgi:xanthine dehydrogenase accessory factor
MLTLIRGAGDLASGIALRLYRSGMQVVMTDLPKPLAIRRTVAFSEAIVHGKTEVEGVRAERAETAKQAMELVRAGKIAVLADPELDEARKVHPDVIVDAILAKKNTGTTIDDAPVVIGVGPGFTAGEDCHAVVETMRGHTLGRTIYRGSALPNTNIPGLIGGFAGERVLRAPKDGVFTPEREIGDTVRTGECVGFVDGAEVLSTLDGVLRGLIAEGTQVFAGLKIGDVDPRSEKDYCFTASDKALAIGGGVLEAILHLTHPFK